MTDSGAQRVRRRLNGRRTESPREAVDAVLRGPSPMPPKPNDAELEFRCDCGGLIGYAHRTGSGLVVRVRDQAGHVRGWATYKMPADESDLRTHGLMTTCGRHPRLLVGSTWDRSPNGRRKVIVSLHPSDHDDPVE